MKQTILTATVSLLLFLALAPRPQAQELSLLGGATRDGKIHDSSYAWAIEYLQGVSEHTAFSVAWMNEGHFPYHHRDGNAFQYWGRMTAFHWQLALAAGGGIYRYFDTTEAAHGGSYSDVHGWGAIESLSATWYTRNRWLLQARMNWIQAACPKQAALPTPNHGWVSAAPLARRWGPSTGASAPAWPRSVRRPSAALRAPDPAFPGVYRLPTLHGCAGGDGPAWPGRPASKSGAGPGLLQTAAGLRRCMSSRLRPHP
jgi:hypothetical protein